ncbi:MAG TPA: response regulator [bacterium]|nr:response regulator [bacterium]
MVDDNEEYLLVIEQMFHLIIEEKDQNIDVVPFLNPKKALRYIRENFSSVCMIVTDQNMPEMEGHELLNSMSCLVTEAALPFRVMCASEAKYHVDKCLSFNRNQVFALNKPVNFDTYYSLLENLFIIIKMREEQNSFPGVDIQNDCVCATTASSIY